MASRMPVRRTTSRRRTDGIEDAERAAADGAPAPWGPAAGVMTPAQLLALQRAGAGNALLARAIGDELDLDEDDEEEVDGDGGAAPPLRMHLPSLPDMHAPPAPFPPALGLELPIMLPREHLPPEMLTMFGLQPPVQEPLLLLEYHPMEPEAPADEAESETPVEAAVEPPVSTQPDVGEPQAEEEGAQSKKKPRKRTKKGKGPGAEQVEATAEKPPAPAPKPVAPAPAPGKQAHEMSIEEMLAFIGPESPAPQKVKQSKTPKPNKQQLEARAKKLAAEKAEEEADELKLLAEEKKRAEEEVAQRQTFRQALAIRVGGLQSARDAHPNDPAHRDIRKEADDAAKTLTAWLNGDEGTKASASELKAELETLNKLVLKVENFQPPETEEQRRQRKFNEVKANVTLRLAGAKWEGAFGGQTDFSVDKHDPKMRTMIMAEYGRDTDEVPGHAGKTYPGKTSTTKVYYFVTYSSHTPGIAYDISLHPYEGGTKLPTVHVLHIPHKTG